MAPLKYVTSTSTMDGFLNLVQDLFYNEDDTLIYCNLAILKLLVY